MGYGGDAESNKTRAKEDFSEDSFGTKTKQLNLDDAAVAKIIKDVLGGTQGLASIFGGEQNAGIFNSSVANQAAGGLVANIIGELAKITGEEVTTDENFRAGKRKSTNEETNFSTSGGYGTYSAN